MKWLNKFVAFALLALWLPATQHCDLEALGVFSVVSDTHGSDADCCKTNQLCSDHGCDLVESGIYTPTANISKVPAPDWSADACIFLFHLVAPDVDTEPVLRLIADSGPPLAGQNTWQFSRRAALPARAPSLI